MNTVMNRLDLDTINTMDREDFVEALGSAFENAPWVAEQAWAARPFATVETLHEAMLEVVRRSPRGTLLAFLRGHPELAGREAEAGTMTSESVSEQASAGLDALSAAEVAELRRLNAGYLDRHGFPFIVAVRRSSKREIFAQLRERLERGYEDELQEALRQIGVITGLRLAALVAPS